MMWKQQLNIQGRSSCRHSWSAPEQSSMVPQYIYEYTVDIQLAKWFIMIQLSVSSFHRIDLGHRKWSSHSYSLILIYRYILHCTLAFRDPLFKAYKQVVLNCAFWLFCVKTNLNKLSHSSRSIYLTCLGFYKLDHWNPKYKEKSSKKIGILDHNNGNWVK